MTTVQRIFRHTGEDQELTLPPDVTSIQVAAGAAKNATGPLETPPLSPPALRGSMAVPAGARLLIRVGAGARPLTYDFPAGEYVFDLAGGWPDGGRAANGENPGYFGGNFAGAGGAGSTSISVFDGDPLLVLPGAGGYVGTQEYVDAYGVSESDEEFPTGGHRAMLFFGRPNFVPPYSEDRFRLQASQFMFLGESPPAEETPELAADGAPTVNYRTPYAPLPDGALNEGQYGYVDGRGGAGRGNPSRPIGAGGGGGGWGGGAGGSGVTSFDNDPRVVSSAYYGGTAGRMGGFLLPVERPDDWPDDDYVYNVGVDPNPPSVPITPDLTLWPAGADFGGPNLFTAYTPAELQVPEAFATGGPMYLDTKRGMGYVIITYDTENQPLNGWSLGHIRFGDIFG